MGNSFICDSLQILLFLLYYSLYKLFIYTALNA